MPIDPVIRGMNGEPIMIVRRPINRDMQGNVIGIGGEPIVRDWSGKAVSVGGQPVAHYPGSSTSDELGGLPVANNWSGQPGAVVVPHRNLPPPPAPPATRSVPRPADSSPAQHIPSSTTVRPPAPTPEARAQREREVRAQRERASRQAERDLAPVRDILSECRTLAHSQGADLAIHAINKCAEALDHRVEHAGILGDSPSAGGLIEGVYELRTALREGRAR